MSGQGILLHLFPFLTSVVFFDDTATLSIGIGNESAPTAMAIKTSVHYYENLFR
jgi:hypothetical protein